MGEKKVNGHSVDFPFVRGGVFESLDDYKKSRPIKVLNKNMVYSLQANLPDLGHDYSHGIRVKQGDFYEIISKGIFGGVLKREQKVERINGDDLLSQPDLFLPYASTYIFREVKSFSRANALKLYDGQMNTLAQLQLGEFKVPPIIEFILFRHNLEKVTKNYGKAGKLPDLVRDLAKNTGFMISLPLSAAYAIYDNASPPNTLGEKQFPFTSRYEWDPREPKSYSWCTKVKQRGLNKLLVSPEETFFEMGINPDNYSFTKSRFSTKVKINNNIIKSFPVLIIKERDSYAELKNLEDRVKDRDSRMEMHYSWNCFSQEDELLLEDKLPPGVTQEDLDDFAGF